MEKETINEALGLSQEWRDAAMNNVESCINESETLSEVMEKIAILTKEGEFGEPSAKGYELTSYEKKLIYSGYMIAQEIHVLQALAAKREIMADMIKMMLGKSDSDLGKLFGDLGLDPDAE